MVLEPTAARAFLADYKRLLNEAHRLAGGQATGNMLHDLALGRDAIEEAPDLLARALASLEERGEAVPDDIRRAIETVRLRQWVYVRDFARRSIFIDAEENKAYGVVGLTGPIRTLLGGAGVAFRAGVVEFCGRYVCDGILKDQTWLGASSKRDFSAQFVVLRREGRFHVACEL